MTGFSVCEWQALRKKIYRRIGRTSKTVLGGNSMMITDDPGRDFDRWEREQEEWSANCREEEKDWEGIYAE